MIKIQQKSLVAAKYNRSLHYLYNIYLVQTKILSTSNINLTLPPQYTHFLCNQTKFLKTKFSDPKKNYKKKNHLKFSFKLLPLVSSCNRINILDSFLHRSACYKQNKLTHINHTPSFLKQRQRHKLLCQYTTGWIQIKNLM